MGLLERRFGRPGLFFVGTNKPGAFYDRVLAEVRAFRREVPKTYLKIEVSPEARDVLRLFQDLREKKKRVILSAFRNKNTIKVINNPALVLQAMPKIDVEHVLKKHGKHAEFTVVATPQKATLFVDGRKYAYFPRGQRRIEEFEE